MAKTANNNSFVEWFRSSSPYIHAHRGKTFVIAFSGEAVAAPSFTNLIHDLALLRGLGIRLVLVHGARPQIEERLKLRSIELQYANGLRITDDQALLCVKEAAGIVRLEIEALLSQGLANSPMAGTRIRVASGNFVTAKPIGVLDGIDYCHTGEVRRVDANAIIRQLECENIVLISPLGYSPTGEIFNLSAADVGARVAIALNADKLIYLSEEKPITRSGGKLMNHLTPAELELLMKRRKSLSLKTRQYLNNAAHSCRSGVKRVHLIERKTDGALLRELFTRDGSGTLITAEAYETTRTARIDDVGGVLELITPLEEKGVLVKRSRDLLENEISQFVVVERDNMIIGCAARYDYPEKATAELACLVIHPDYQSGGRGDALLEYMEKRARAAGLNSLFVLTTQTMHWFQERGFKQTDLSFLPKGRRALYNYRRNSKLAVKQLQEIG
ncbi:MAG: amino-acid N-acetyltransferase [Chromatiales bacterium]|jgi:amino-acid N-acetyltransferase